MKSLSQMNGRLLNLIASMLAGREVVVICTERAARHVTGAFEHVNLILHPYRAGLRDLFVTAKVLSHRAVLRRRSAQQAERILAKLGPKLVREAYWALKAEYPKLDQLPGRFEIDRPETWPHLSWSSVTWDPAAETSCGRGTSLLHAPSVEIVGGDDDFAQLIAALQDGSFPLEHWLALREMPIARVPIKNSTAVTPGAKYERYHNEIERLAKDGLLEKLKSCYLRKAESAQFQGFRGRERKHGTILNLNRLAQVAVARRSGIEPRLFKDRTRTYQPIFQAEIHLVCVAVDLNGFRNGTLDDPAFSYRVLGLLVRMYDELGVNLVVLGFLDHVLRLDGGRSIYLHAPCVLKSVQEPVSGAFFNRLVSMIEEPPVIPAAEPACFVPLAMRTILETLRSSDHELGSDRSYHTVCLAAKRGMPPPLNQESFWSRTAQALDRLLDDYDREFPGVFDTLGCFISDDVKRFGRRGGRVSRMF